MSDREEEKFEEERARREQPWDEQEPPLWSDADEEEDQAYFEKKARARKRLKKILAVLLAAVLLANVLSFWPMLYNMQAIRFLSVSRELSRSDQVSGYKQAVAVVGSKGGKGTGFVVSSGGYIVTNYHVIEGKSSLFVSFPKGKSYPAEVVSSNPSADLALLRIDPGDAALHALPLNRAGSAQSGDSVYIIGNPLMFDRVANAGTIVGEMPIDSMDIPIIAIEAPIYKGNSGSPVINEQGEVVAVVFATASIERSGETMKVGLAIPIRYLLSDLDRLGVSLAQ
ncbi:S1C family serine protease [Paenibacillus ginsengarvi]|uniref:Serine protease n=1 Tax=Paenibacillus ginsengarvi TaxID=400777 RepID=A0A3B0CFM1_9BACL|nr:serine protease [Paenibacillus ginsengarvi]RKN84393.1 serine protease [Paenibacillus ginsengarvi]